MDPNASVTMLSGIGAGGKRAAALERHGIRTIRDLASMASHVVINGCAKARLEAIAICGSAAPSSQENPERPERHARNDALMCSWTGLRAHIWAEPGVLVRCTIVGAVTTPAGVCALTKFVRLGQVHHRAVTFQYLTSVAVQHSMRACHTDDDELTTTSALGISDPSRSDLLLNTPLILHGGDASQNAFVVREVEDIAQIR
jgi:hypothetical protein